MHATTLELEAYVMGALDAERASELDVHVEACAECAQALLGEARVELAVRAYAAELRCGMRADVVEAPAVVVEAAPQASPRPGFYALAAVAAALLAFAATHLPRARLSAPAPAVLLTDAGDFTAVHRPAVFLGEPSGGTP